MNIQIRAAVTTSHTSASDVPAVPTDLLAYVGQIVPCTEAEGPGWRFAIWFQGCPLRCPGCCNPHFLPFNGGQQIPVADIVVLLDQAMQNHPQLEGITLLGGEPTAQAVAAAALAKAAWYRGLTVLMFSGYTLEQLQQRDDPAVSELLAHTDMLVDGPYDHNQPETRRRWIGSANQRLHFLSSRCQWDDRWLQKNTVEIRLRNKEITINGYPSSAVLAWSRKWLRRT
ncbi:MAG: radical SAM protein [Gemmataceae bacterium]|nr:radical SAM protein [Gemmataceae bacterium]MCS7270657.1 radical SAM protein [Gemmataceae bacterium]MDW8243654.1 4Fe-4S single cluster domain-containing protein [Thermogemmata sp.]